MSKRTPCPLRCACLCHDTGGVDSEHIPGLAGCPGKHGYTRAANGRDWIRGARR